MSLPSCILVLAPVLTLTLSPTTSASDYGASAASPSVPQMINASPITEQPRTDLTWTMFRHDARHTGYSTGMGTFFTPLLNWTFDTYLQPEGFLGTPAIGDVDNDGRAEVLFCSMYRLYCVDGGSGALEWEFNPYVDPFHCHFRHHSPVISDIDADGQVEVIVGSYKGQSHADSYVFCLRGHDGSLKWSFTNTGSEMTSSATIGDADSDGNNEILVSSFRGWVLCISNLGAEKWRAELGYNGGIHYESTPALADVNNDGTMEVVAQSQTSDGIFCLRGANGSVLWSYPTGCNSAEYGPSLANLDSDAELEIVAASCGCGVGGQGVVCLEGSNGAKKWFFSTGSAGVVESYPSPVDVDRDGQVEVVFGAHVGGVWCVNGRTGAEEWHSTIPGGELGACSTVVCDIDGDAELEILIGAPDGYLHCLDEHGSQEWAFATGGSTYYGASVGDADGDGWLDVVFGSYEGKFYCLGIGPNCPPTGSIVSITPNPAQEGQLIAFTGQATDSDGSIAGYEWRSSIDDLIGTETTFSRSDLSFGTHTITFRARDDDGAWSAPRFMELRISPIASTENLTDAINDLEEAYLQRVDVMTIGMARTLAWTYKGVHDTSDWEYLHYILTGYFTLHQFLQIVLEGVTPSLLVETGVGQMVETSLDYMDDQEVKARWAATTHSVFDDLSYPGSTSVEVLTPMIEDILFANPSGLYIDHDKQMIETTFDELRQYVAMHAAPPQPECTYLIYGIQSLASDIREANEKGEDALYRWYSPNGHLDPPADGKVYHARRSSDWTIDLTQCDYVEEMRRLWEQAEQGEYVHGTAFAVTATFVGGIAAVVGMVALICLLGPGAALLGFFMFSTLWGAAELTGYTLYRYQEMEGKKAMLVATLGAQAAYSMDLASLKVMLDDMETYIEVSVDPAYPEDWFPWSTGRVVDVDIPDIAAAVEDTVVVGSGTFSVRNTGPLAVKVGASWDLRCLTGPNAGKCLSVCGPVEITEVAAGTTGAIPFEFVIPGPQLAGCSGLYIALPHIMMGTSPHCQLMATNLPNLFFWVQLRGPRGELARDQVVNEVMADSLLQGDVRDTTYVPVGYETAWLLNFPDHDLDLHIYDALGGHVGMNYETGQVEMQIPGAVYTGASSCPEIITVLGSAGQEYQVVVRAVTTEGYQWFSVSAVERPEQPGTMALLGFDAGLVAAPADTARRDVPLAEVGGHHGVENVDFSFGDLIGPSYTIPSANVSWQSDVTAIAAGGVITPWLRVRVPEGAPGGVYHGDVQVSSNGGSETFTLTLNVDAPPNVPGTPVGPTEGDSGTPYTYTTRSTDPEGHGILYGFNWGDGVGRQWFGPFPSGAPCEASHVWEAGGTYDITVAARDTLGATSEASAALQLQITSAGIPEAESTLPSQVELARSLGNPLRVDAVGGIDIPFALPTDCLCRLQVFDVLGRRVATLLDGREKAGYRVARFDARSLSSGVYYLSLTAGEVKKSKVVIVLR